MSPSTTTAKPALRDFAQTCNAAYPRCVKWPRLGRGKTPPYCDKVWCPYPGHGTDARNKRRRYYAKQFPAEMAFYAWIVKANCPVTPKEATLINDATKRGIRSLNPEAVVNSIAHWQGSFVHLHVFLWVPPNVSLFAAECNAAVREALRREGKNADPQRRADIATDLRFADLWDEKTIWNGEPVTALHWLNYACKCWKDLTYEDCPARGLKGARLKYGFKDPLKKKNSKATTVDGSNKGLLLRQTPVVANTQATLAQGEALAFQGVGPLGLVTAPDAISASIVSLDDLGTIQGEHVNLSVLSHGRDDGNGLQEPSGLGVTQ